MEEPFAVTTAGTFKSWLVRYRSNLSMNATERVLEFGGAYRVRLAVLLAVVSRS